MRRTLLSAALVLIVAAAWLGTPASAATITGTVTYKGQVPTFQPISMDADPVCKAKHTEPVYPEVLVLGPGDTMANVMVHVKSGVKETKFPVPSAPVVMDQRGCRYHPHVMGIMVGQTFKVLNSDGLLHNVHALPRVNSPFNMAMPPTVKESEKTFGQAEGMFMIKCDVHPWMNAFIGVMSNPFFSVTEKDGKFTISGLKAGTYEIEAWHEKLGAKTATVTVGADETKKVDFSFSPPGK